MLNIKIYPWDTSGIFHEKDFPFPGSKIVSDYVKSGNILTHTEGIFRFYRVNANMTLSVIPTSTVLLKESHIGYITYYGENFPLVYIGRLIYFQSILEFGFIVSKIEACTGKILCKNCNKRLVCNLEETI